MTFAAVHGFIMALELIVPLGVQNVFVFNQGALHKRFRDVLPVVATASLCDRLLIAAAVIWLNKVSAILMWDRISISCQGFNVRFLMIFSVYSIKFRSINKKNRMFKGAFLDNGA
ncbi:hypothetical protein [Paenibacillus sp. FJAT-26967]|uniref:hypothetical protein n=1 Tax=Paenibacillus sp. FJAT-26967 TaxID=1729690 RepID=UPI000837D9BC